MWKLEEFTVEEEQEKGKEVIFLAETVLIFLVFGTFVPTTFRLQEFQFFFGGGGCYHFCYHSVAFLILF